MRLFVFTFFMLFPMLLFLFAWGYKSDRKFFTCLRDKMAVANNVREYWRKLYVYLLLLVLIFMHVAYNCVFPHNYGIMVSTAILIYLANTKRAIGLMKAVANRKAVSVFMMTLVLAMAIGSIFATEFLPTAMTLGYLLVASLIFPDYKYIRTCNKRYKQELKKKMGEEKETSVATDADALLEE